MTADASGPIASAAEVTNALIVVPRRLPLRSLKAAVNDPIQIPTASPLKSLAKYSTHGVRATKKNKLEVIAKDRDSRTILLRPYLSAK